MSLWTCPAHGLQSVEQDRCDWVCCPQCGGVMTPVVMAPHSKGDWIDRYNAQHEAEHQNSPPTSVVQQQGANAAEQASGEERPTRGPLPTVLFNGVPARSVVRLPDGAILAEDGAILAEAPLPEGLPLVRIIEAWLKL